MGKSYSQDAREQYICGHYGDGETPPNEAERLENNPIVYRAWKNGANKFFLAAQKKEEEREMQEQREALEQYWIGRYIDEVFKPEKQEFLDTRGFKWNEEDDKDVAAERERLEKEPNIWKRWMREHETYGELYQKHFMKTVVVAPAEHVATRAEPQQTLTDEQSKLIDTKARLLSRAARRAKGMDIPVPTLMRMLTPCVDLVMQEADTLRSTINDSEKEQAVLDSYAQHGLGIEGKFFEDDKMQAEADRIREAVQREVEKKKLKPTKSEEGFFVAAITEKQKSDKRLNAKLDALSAEDRKLLETKVDVLLAAIRKRRVVENPYRSYAYRRLLPFMEQIKAEATQLERTAESINAFEALVDEYAQAGVSVKRNKLFADPELQKVVDATQGLSL